MRVPVFGFWSITVFDWAVARDGRELPRQVRVLELLLRDGEAFAEHVRHRDLAFGAAELGRGVEDRPTTTARPMITSVVISAVLRFWRV